MAEMDGSALRLLGLDGAGMDVPVEELRGIAARATRRLTQEYALYEIQQEPLINAAMVRAVLLAARERGAPAPAAGAEPVVGELPVAEKAQPARRMGRPPRSPEERAARREEQAARREGLREQVAELMRGMAVGGVMPSLRQWDELRPAGMMSAKMVCHWLGMTWAQVGEGAGLWPAKAGKPLAADGPPSPQEAALRAEVLTTLRGMAVGGVMPTQREWDDRRPPHLPTNTSLRRMLRARWSELAVEAGLAPGKRFREEREEMGARRAERVRQEAVAALRGMAVDGRMPAQGVWNRGRPAGLPTAETLIKQTRLTWRELGEAAGLLPLVNPQRSAEALAAMRARRQRAVQGETRPGPVESGPPGVDVPAPPPAPPVVEKPVVEKPVVAARPAPRPAPVVVTVEAAVMPGRNGNAAVAAVLGPEHVVVSPLREPGRAALPPSAEARQRLWEEVAAALRAMAVDGRIPSILTWRDQRPKHLPRARDVMARFGYDNWAEVARAAGLRFGDEGKGRKGKDGDDE
jgi:hypothetical protein